MSLNLALILSIIGGLVIAYLLIQTGAAAYRAPDKVASLHARLRLYILAAILDGILIAWGVVILVDWLLKWK